MTDSTLSSVANALKILKSFTNDAEVWRVSDLANKLSVSKSTVSRLIKTLVSEGFLEKDTNTAGYRLGSYILTLGGIYASTSEIYQEGGPVLNEIVLQTNESAHVAILQNLDVVYLNKAGGPYYSDIHSQVGLHNPLHATSSGKVLLAYTDPTLIDQIIDRGLEAYTEYTITNPMTLRKEIDQVRKLGYSISQEERTVNNYSIAVPVWNYENKVVCSLCIIGPLSRYTQNKEKKYVSVLQEAAQSASERLGYEGTIQWP